MCCYCNCSHFKGQEINEKVVGKPGRSAENMSCLFWYPLEFAKCSWHFIKRDCYYASLKMKAATFCGGKAEIQKI